MARTWLLLALWLVLVVSAGCRAGSTVGTTDPEAKLRLERLLEFYLRHADQKGKGPPNEHAFKEFIRKVSRDEPGRAGVGEDLDQLLTSPRDGQKYLVRYGLTIDRAGDAQPVAWEHTGSGGNRFVALSMGYVEEYSEQGFKQFKK